MYFFPSLNLLRSSRFKEGFSTIWSL